MSESPIASREAALRIALAARALNDLDVRALVGALLEKLGSAFQNDFRDDDLSTAGMRVSFHARKARNRRRPC